MIGPALDEGDELGLEKDGDGTELEEEELGLVEDDKLKLEDDDKLVLEDALGWTEDEDELETDDELKLELESDDELELEDNELELGRELELELELELEDERELELEDDDDELKLEDVLEAIEDEDELDDEQVGGVLVSEKTLMELTSQKLRSSQRWAPEKRHYTYPSSNVSGWRATCDLQDIYWGSVDGKVIGQSVP
jgi:hypothetical protein